MAENQISASLTPANRQAVMDAIATIKDKLPFLVDLTTEERRTLPKMGDKRLDICHHDMGRRFARKSRKAQLRALKVQNFSTQP